MNTLRKLLFIFFCFAGLLGLYKHANSSSAAKTSQAMMMTVNGAIGPASADYLVRGIEVANREQATLAIIRMDTPGGLDKSMRTIIKAILSSKVPVCTYVSPSGARAASAGTFILYASHIAAMAPGTNLGAASPVSLTGGGMMPGGEKDKDKKSKPKSKSNSDTLKSKVMNDAVSYIRSLAQQRGRDVQFAEDAVKKAATLTASEALQKNVIDIVAADVPSLLTQINGRRVKMNGKTIELKTAGISLKTITPDWRNKFLAVITDPSVAYVLLLIGVYGIFFEFANPGFIVPGVCGAIALLLAMYALQLLPINYAGLALILLGMSFMVAEAFMPSFGALGIGGVIAFIAGSVLLFDTQVAGFSLAWSLILSMALVNLVFFVFVLGMAIKARRRKVVSGREDLIGKEGVVLGDFTEQGQAQVSGEIWQVKSDAPLKKGDKIRVVGIDGLCLNVKAFNDE